MNPIQAYKTQRKKHPGIYENLEAIVIGLTITLVLIQFIGTGRVNGESMINTLQDKDMVLMEKLTYKWRGPSRGDVVAIDTDKHPTNIVKRIIAIPGDHLVIDEVCHVYINNQLQEESFLTVTMAKPCQSIDLTMQKDEIFVMGDNRNNSKDSRVFGKLSFSKEVIGRVFFKIFPFSSFGGIKK